MVPLYIYPGPEWEKLIEAKASHPSVDILAVINPDNGPGAALDNNYVNWANRLRSAQIHVLGYVHTSYGSRKILEVIHDVEAYKSWYDAEGIFFDEMSTVPGKESYYFSLRNKVDSMGMGFPAGNPGTTISPSYWSTMKIINIYENAGYSNFFETASREKRMFSKNARGTLFSTIIYECMYFDTSLLKDLSNVVSYLYLTDKGLPNPYDRLPNYLLDLISKMDHVSRGVRSEKN